MIPLVLPFLYTIVSTVLLIRIQSSITEGILHLLMLERVYHFLFVPDLCSFFQDVVQGDTLELLFWCFSHLLN